MSSYHIEYFVARDSYHLVYSALGEGTSDEGILSDGDLVPEGDWTAFVSPYQVSYGAAGLLLRLETDEVLEFLAVANRPANTPNVTYVPFQDRWITLRVEHSSGILTYSWSYDMLNWIEVGQFSPSSPVVEVGVVLRYDRPDLTAAAELGEARLLKGLWQSLQEEVLLGEPESSVMARAFDEPPGPSVLSTSEPLVHCVIGAQFGDLEFDVGKSVRWVTWFTDNVFILDVNLGTPRYWIVNWTQTFPDAKHAVTGINYFVRPVDFRKEQWKQYKLAFGEPANDEWFLFVDGHEGLSVDNRSLPDDYDFAPFKSFLWREIQRAQDLGESSAVLPYYVFLRSDHITNVSYGVTAPTPDPEGNPPPPVIQALSVPYYEPYQGLRRLWNAAALKDPSFDWSQIDTPVTPSASAKAQILSYGYAHWNLQDIEPPATTVPPLDASNDQGWEMRQLLSRVRPIPGLPVSGTWVPPYEPYKLRRGTCITSAQLSNTNYTGVILNPANGFTGITPEWEMQWGQIHPANGTFNWVQTDAIVNWATAHGLTSRGHCLVWDGGGNPAMMPNWVTGGSWTRTTLLAALQTHITTIVNRYKDRIHVWNCVNEAFEDSGARTTWVMQTVIGNDWIEQCFNFAHAADPTAILLYNDYGNEWGHNFGSGSANPKFVAILNMLIDFKARGIPCHGVGIQGHYDTQYATYPHDVDFPLCLDDYIAAGMLVDITEMDVRVDHTSDTDAVEQARQAEIATLVNTSIAARSEDSIGVGLWGLTDAASWLGAMAKAAPWDASYNPKPFATAFVAPVVGPPQLVEIAGLPGPWAPADVNNPDPVDPSTGEPIDQPVDPDPSLEGLVTPLYDCVFRLNMRDGVWYEAGVSGNIPLRWDDASQTWTTDYDPDLWAKKGVKSYDPTAVPDPVP